jgi:hypothetical protein
MRGLWRLGVARSWPALPCLGCRLGLWVLVPGGLAAPGRLRLGLDGPAGIHHLADALLGVGAGVDVEPQRGLDAVVAENLGDVRQLAGVGVQGLAGELVAQRVRVNSGDAEVVQLPAVLAGLPAQVQVPGSVGALPEVGLADAQGFPSGVPPR